MTDSFADLWSSSAPTNKTTKPTLGSLSSSSSFNNASSSSTRGVSSSNDLFSKLSSASGPSSRLGSRVGTPSLGAGQTQTPSQSQSRKGGGDAFDGLFSSTGLSNTSTNMTMAQRAAEAERLKMVKVVKAQAATAKSNAAWDGLDILGSSSSSQTQPQARVDRGALDSGSNWEFSITTDAGSRTTTKTNVSVDEDDDWGLGDFASAPSSTSTRTASKTSKSFSNQSQAGSLFDLDGFESGNGKGSQISSTVAGARVDSPSHDFDWGNREGRDGLLGSGSRDTMDEEDDILGDLGKSVQEVSRRPSRSSSPSYSNTGSKPSGTPQRRSSPPPHILGQLVEMGFSIAQAKTALAATDNGEDVQGALDILISNGAAEGGSRSRSARSSPDEEDERERARKRGQRHDNRRPELHQRPVGQRQGSGRDRQDVDRALRQREREGGAQAQNISEQADKLLSQASTIGLSLFNRANAAWKGAGERVQKAYEEHVANNERPKASGSSTRGPSDGRPKWWREDSAGDDGNEGSGPSNTAQRRKQRNEERDRERFFDDDENRDVGERRKQAKPPSPRPEPEPEPEVDLFSSAPEPVKARSTSNGVYVSPFRHGRPKPKPQNQTQPTSVSPSPSFPAKSESIHPSTLVLASPAALRASAAHKNKGTEFFKLGDFPASEGEYTKAIDCLPSGQTLLIALYNNRALVRLKVGNSTGAIEDAGQVIDLVGTENAGTVRGGVEGGATSLDGVDLEVNLGDAIVKAWKRRAEALEGKEKWAEAGKDWERVAGAEWAGQGVRGEGVRGAGRCRRMEKQTQDPEETKVKTPPARPKPKPKAPTPTRIAPDSEALKSLRQANAAAENEDAEKHALKDGVDAKLTAWKGGKENNIRALLASLELVLWPELGVPKWGMHELISEGQVKVKYMKAIAKVHPDKLSSGNFSVEQKMLAQGVFGALNDAWNSSK